MLPQFSNKVLASFSLWAENRLINLGQAYKNYTSTLYQQSDVRLPSSKVSYNAPFKQWVYDSGINGANIINEVKSGPYTLNRASGVIFDYDNGRVIMNTGVLPSNASVTGTYAFKEINVYLTNESQDALITQDKPYLNPRFHGTPTEPTKPYTIQTPAIFISNLHAKNEPWTFGGTDMSHMTLTITVMVETVYQLDAVFSIFADMYHHHVPLLNTFDDPMNEWGDLKCGSFNYNQLLGVRGTPGSLMYVNDVTTSRVSDKVKVNQNLFMGIIDVELIYPRNTYSNTNEGVLLNNFDGALLFSQ